MKNKKEYFKYLFELLVVFIGVTAAFMSDRLAEEKRDKKQESYYMVNLYGEIQANEIGLNKLLVFYKEKLNNLDRLMEQLNKKASDDTIDTLTAAALFTNKFFEPDSSTWESLKASGAMKVIGDIDLKILLTKLYSSYSSATLLGYIVQEFVRENMLKYALNRIDMQRITFFNRESAFEPYFINLVAAYRILTNSYYLALKETNDICIKTKSYIWNLPVVKNKNQTDKNID